MSRLCSDSVTIKYNYLTVLIQLVSKHVSHNVCAVCRQEYDTMYLLVRCSPPHTMLHSNITCKLNYQR